MIPVSSRHIREDHRVRRVDVVGDLDTPHQIEGSRGAIIHIEFVSLAGTRVASNHIGVAIEIDIAQCDRRRVVSVSRNVASTFEGAVPFPAISFIFDASVANDKIDDAVVVQIAQGDSGCG